MKILLVSGARPNYMKVAPLVWELRRLNRENPSVRYLLLHTGQHYSPELYGTFFKELNLPEPDYDLSVGSGSHAAQTAETMLRFEPILERERPDVVVVVGDVNSTVACALTAAKLGIRVAHVEAGLRSFDRTMPEEINRVVTDALADYLFTTEAGAKENLIKEGIPRAKIFFVGNVMIDVVLQQKPLWEVSSVLADLGLQPGRYAVLTLHRPSNVDDQATFERICIALEEIGRKAPVIFPCHPRTRHKISLFGMARYFKWHAQPGESGIHVVDPMGHWDFLKLMKEAKLILTDSGGIQEEATVLGTPCLTLRGNTERPVTTTEGTNVVVGTDGAKIVRVALRMLDENFSTKGARVPQLWDGKAGERIVAVIVNRLWGRGCPLECEGRPASDLSTRPGLEKLPAS